MKRNNAESEMDFIHKLGIAQKETAETQYFLELLEATDYLTEKEFQSLYSDVEEVMKLLRSSILTKKKNLGLKAITILMIAGSCLITLITYHSTLPIAIGITRKI